MERVLQTAIGALFGLGALLLVLWAINSVWDNSLWGDHDYNKVVQPRDFLVARGFNPDIRHRVMAAQTVDEGKSLDFTVNVGSGGRRAIDVLVPTKGKINYIVVPDGKKMYARFVYNYDPLWSTYTYRAAFKIRVDDPYAPHSGGAAAEDLMLDYDHAGLGELVANDSLHAVTFTVTRTVYDRIKAERAT